MMNYERSEPLSGDARRAMDFLAATLAAAGFRIDDRTDTMLLARGPGMQSTRQGGMAAISQIRLSVQGGQLRAEADLRGATRLFLILGFVFGTLAVVGCIVMYVALPKRDRTPAHFAVFLALSPWVIILPAMAKWMVVLGRRAVDQLLHNATVNSR